MNGQLKRCEKMKKILNILQNYCVGCGTCHNICPKDAINMVFDKEGYLKPEIDKEKCIACGLCDNYCPVLNPNYPNQATPKCYAVLAEDNVRKESSSGGVFSILADKVLNQNGVVFGSAWTDDFFVKVQYAETADELNPLKRSKYCQTDVGLAFRKVKNLLEDKRPVLYVGTPCQIAGLNNFLQHTDTSKLITVDFICYYNPSINMIRFYLEDSYGLNNISSFSFRDKTYGWISHAFSVRSKDGNETRNKNVTSYFQGYFNALYESEACTHCAFSSLSRQGDITIGDFWKIEAHKVTLNDGKGTSMVLTNNEKGENFFNTVSERWKHCEEVPLSWIREGQTNSKLAHRNSQYFNALVTEKNFNTAVDMAMNGKYDIGFVCVQSYQNYGSAITNYAMYHVLRDLKYSVLIVTQPMTSINKPTDAKNFESTPYPQYSEAKIYKDTEEMKELNNICNQFVVGSDQLFNYEIYKLIDGFVKLDWVEDNHIKLAYAASFGQDQLLGPSEEREKLAASLKRFSGFSVREQSGIILTKKLGIQAENVLDPVFLCQKIHYENLIDAASPILFKNNYIFSYILDPTENKERIIKTYSKKMNKNNLVLSDRWRNKSNLASLWGMDTVIGYTNEQWLKAMCDSDFVITDSFHGMCFAIIFKKPFIALVNKKRGATRFYSLAKLLGLEKRLIDIEENAVKDVDRFINDIIDYHSVYKVLEKEKTKGLQWLSIRLQAPFGANCSRVKQTKNDMINLSENEKGPQYLGEKNKFVIRKLLRRIFQR